MKRMVTATGATYLSVYDAICRDNRCDELVQGNIPMQFDGGHLTAEGAIEVGRRLSAAFARKRKGQSMLELIPLRRKARRGGWCRFWWPLS